MIEIKYMKSASGFDNCFNLVYCEKEYIPESYFENNEKGDQAQIRYYLDLFEKNSICKRDSGRKMIWSAHWSCRIDGIPFSMDYDVDWDMVSFSMGEKYIEKREYIANALKKLIEKAKDW